MAIHPTAVIDKKAEIDSSAEIGPYVIIEGQVKIAANCHIQAHAVITGWTTLEADCQVFPHAVIGHAPQDLAYKGEETYCHVGQGCILREGVTIHRGTQPGSTTRVGNHCFLMAYAHVGHNSIIGDHVIMANNTLSGGHVSIGEGTFMGGGSGIHQFVRIGERAIIAGLIRATMDLPPYFMSGDVNICNGVNMVGLRRAGYGPAERRDAINAYKILYRSGMNFSQAVEKLGREAKTAAGKKIYEFVSQESRRGIMGPPRDRSAVTDE
jgi:UDP-N-acetylglucosamine acyltransferase